MSSKRGVMRSCVALAAVRAPITTCQVAVRSFSSLRFEKKEKLADESILDHLVCPLSKYPLRYDTARGSLICDEINVEYPIYQGVPMLTKEMSCFLDNTPMSKMH
ncbi:hypothetical protein BBO99_00000664 [Phytophthora kernoviae]|uniref:Protein preY, mitochondrial n=2 Tax=Phytophthora kernoviae TaxID=325452 RepID=A0A421FH87_9STRA|nr:hypothetical protein G195_004407 [Phytophthora kernoviae 00238/432]KAG2510563.1 hypothetical protein JM16_008500 [Phytophthora kernoviae]KAG2512897.1 hypothetical protein JM18_008522 [Phytophthora kernoviae]RLN44855.1 hypothetical protein BBI17_002803 [Phytophthora kernoviae]RLN85270.1 hypothetical protein BBO99_00000664 [Phytophthora kernoviae]